MPLTINDLDNIAKNSTNVSFINNIVNQMKKENSSLVFEDFKQCIGQIKQISIKEDDDLAILFYNQNYSGKNSENNMVQENNNFLSKFEDLCRSVVLDKKTLKIIVSQYNKIIYNDNAFKLLQGKNWKNVVIHPCIEGTILIVFNHNNKWYVSTRRCLDASESIWIKNSSYQALFDETCKELGFDITKLNPKFCYHFILVHHKNKNIVTFPGKEYRDLYHILTTEKYTLNEMECKLLGPKIIKQEFFPTIDQFIKHLKSLSEKDMRNKIISIEGYIIKFYLGEPNKSPFILMKIQTELYQQLLNIRPNNNNIYQIYLQLYQQDKLQDYVPFFSSYPEEIITRIKNTVNTFAHEIMELYFITRNGKNTALYELLPGSYKKLIYDVHGIYINKKSPIKASDIFNYLKKMEFPLFRKLFQDRMALLENLTLSFLNRECSDIRTQTSLMFDTKI